MVKNSQKSANEFGATVYQLHIALEDVNPLIWRRVWVCASLSLVKLHRVIQVAMGWTNAYLHEFQIAQHRYGPADCSWRNEGLIIDEKRLTIGVLLDEDISSFTYVYDFADNWRHIAVVEKKLLGSAVNTWTQCIDGQNACPPEGVGGTSGYENFLQSVSNPLHPEHIATRRWSGGPFDPKGFDINMVNRELRRLKL